MCDCPTEHSSGTTNHVRSFVYLTARAVHSATFESVSYDAKLGARALRYNKPVHEHLIWYQNQCTSTWYGTKISARALEMVLKSVHKHSIRYQNQCTSTRYGTKFSTRALRARNKQYKHSMRCRNQRVFINWIPKSVSKAETAVTWNQAHFTVNDH